VFLYHHLDLKMNLSRIERNRTEKLIDIGVINSMFKCVSLTSSWSPKWISIQRNGTERKTDRHHRNKFNVQLCFSLIILIFKMNLNRTERNGKTDRHQRNKFDVHVCFSIIILISKMCLNGTEWNWTEKLIDIRRINSMFKCVSLSSWSTKSISTERNGM